MSNKVSVKSMLRLLLQTVGCLLIWTAIGFPNLDPIYLNEARLQLALEELRGPSGVSPLAISWLYSPGDNLKWADPDFDDSEWAIMQSAMLVTDLAENEWTGIGWFRLHLRVDSSLWNKLLSLRLGHLGASELYLNGHLIRTQGKVGRKLTDEVGHLDQHPNSVAIQLGSRIDQVLAVRYSNWSVPKYGRLGRYPGFVIELAPLDETISEVATLKLNLKAHQVGFTAACGVVALMHLLMFAFYHRRLENLYFAIFTTGCAMLTYAPFANVEAISSTVFTWMDLAFKLGLILVGIFGLRFLYALFYRKIPRQFWLFLVTGIILAMSYWTTNIPLFYFYTLFALLEMSRIIIVAVVHKKPGSRIIGLGYSAFVLGCTYQIVEESGLVPLLPSPFRWPYMAGILVMLVSMSFHLARRIADTARVLSRQLEQIQQLSEKSIEQERQAREQEVARKLLEQDVAHKALELEEAKKLKQAMNELEKAHRDLSATQAQLIQSEKMASMGMLVAGVAHEINTPLGAITSMHDTLSRATAKLKKTVTEQFAADGNEDCCETSFKVIDDANRVIKSGCERVTAIVKRLRSFARLDEAELQKVDIHEGIEDTLALLVHEMKHGIEVVRNFGEIPAISCYPSQLNQVFLNILVNACQAMGGKGMITITTSCANNHVRIDISDNGPGIEKSQLERIFDPGYTTKGVGVGTGLGLSICYQIIDDHNGEISVASEPGRGTTFTITLPTDLETLLIAKQNDPKDG